MTTRKKRDDSSEPVTLVLSDMEVFLLVNLFVQIIPQLQNSKDQNDQMVASHMNAIMMRLRAETIRKGIVHE